MYKTKPKEEESVKDVESLKAVESVNKEGLTDEQFVEWEMSELCIDAYKKLKKII